MKYDNFIETIFLPNFRMTIKVTNGKPHCISWMTWIGGRPNSLDYHIAYKKAFKQHAEKQAESNGQLELTF